jgi:hypothetical protein
LGMLLPAYAAAASLLHLASRLTLLGSLPPCFAYSASLRLYSLLPLHQTAAQANSLANLKHNKCCPDCGHTGAGNA